WTFRTMPEKGKSAGFKIGFGGGAAYTPPNEKMWNTIKEQALSGFLFLGDNVYIDHPELPEVQQFCYYQRQSRPEYRAFIAETPIYAIWDDHDFVTNDGWGGPEINLPSWKIPVWQLFQDNWNNPGYGIGAKQPGCWFKFSIANVDFFMLDCRFYRTDPNSENLSMLGPVQLNWLLDELKASRATFKALASSVPWASGTKGGSLDTWDGYSAERNEIFNYITQNKIEGILLLSADRHRSDLWKIFRPEGYHLYEFESSCLTNIHRHETLPGAIFSYNEKPSFGLLEFNTMLPDPEVNYQIVNIENNVVLNFKILKSQLKNKSPEQLAWEKRLQEDDLLNPAFAFVKDDSALPRVLIIGNSISIGYTPFVREFLAGKVNVHRIPENARDTNFGLQRLSEWVGQTEWDVIHFNWGLHDLKRLKDGRYDVTGEQVTPLQQYEDNIEELVRQLKNTGTTLIWASTTPVPSGSSGRIEGDEIKYNQVAEKIMRRHNILINDLHTCILPYLKEYQKPQNVHFTETGSRFLGQKVAETIQQVLLK
ncbi:alkaline phosphatase D family protein, partial [candidate division KSB1 bacterium]|nr:alkaline phosphatase D family protein [candidate division KSB1 bacterium]